jgi:hypothetical protein
VAEEQTCFCLFEAPDRHAVRAANDRAGLSFERIVSALVVTPAPLGRQSAS